MKAVTAIIMIILVTAFCAGMTLAAKDMSAHNILGLRIAMSEDEAKKVIAEMEGKTKVAEMESKNGVRVCYINFSDSRFISITFSKTTKGRLVSEISEVFQGASYDTVLVKELLRQYGKPDQIIKEGMVLQMAWGGKVEEGGGITPAKTTKTTLTLEEIKNRQLTISLIGHKF